MNIDLNQGFFHNKNQQARKLMNYPSLKYNIYAYILLVDFYYCHCV